MTKCRKIMAVLAAFMMVAVAGIVIVQSSDESEAAAGEAGYMNVYINSGSGWSVETVLAANGCEAVKATGAYDSHNDVINDSYTYEYQYGGTWYTNISSNYGDITKLNNIANSTSATWNALVYTPVLDEDEGTYVYRWTAASASLGYYKPFADYASVMRDYGTANIAVWYGDSGNVSSTITSLSNYAVSTNAPRSLTDISTSHGSVFEHIFYLKNKTDTAMTINGTNNVITYNPATGVYSTATLTNAMITAGVYVVGYGSDASLALRNALNNPAGTTNVVFETTTNPVPGFNAYGWIGTIFGIGTVQVSGQDTPNDYTDDHYNYWTTYTTYDEANTYYAQAGFVVGAYSALTNAPLVDGTLALIYEYS